jgi:hypothetical protein
MATENYIRVYPVLSSYLHFDSGFTASFGIAQVLAKRIAPGILS